MTDTTTPATGFILSRTVGVSIGLMTLFCGGMFWVGSTASSISAKLEAIPEIRQDISAMKHLMGSQTASLAQHGAEMDGIRAMFQGLDNRLTALESKVDDLRNRVAKIEK